MKNVQKLLLFFLVATIALASHFMVFTFRYMWGLRPEEGFFLFIGYGLFLLLMLCMWALTPKPTLVALAGVSALAFPPLLRPDVFVGWDLLFLAYVAASVALLMIATTLRSNQLHTIRDASIKSID